MPYSGPDDKSLPSNVKELGDEQRRQWVYVFNSAQARCEKRGGKKCEAFAFRNANGVLKSANLTSLLSGEDSLGRSFIEFSAAEPPETINIFPAPGTYKHPLWGDVEVTEEGNQQFVENFNTHVYQEHVPIDAEHETKVSGAVGYLRGLSLNEDNSIEADVDWTERGQKLIENDSFKYISPEWYEQWKDPASGDEFENILIGAALTTRPFFKNLRSLVASEGRLYDVEEPDGAREPIIRSSVEGVSHEGLRTMILSAARHEFPGIVGAGECSGWVVDLYDDHTIIEASGRYWHLDYSYEDDSVAFSGQPKEVQRKTVWEDTPVRGREFSPEKREDLAAKGQALPDGSYPIVTVGDLTNAIKAYGRGKSKEAVKRHIIKRAKALGKTDLLPEDWSGSAKKSKEVHMVELDMEELTGAVDELGEEEKKGLLTRLASAIKATVSFGGGGGDDDPGEDKPGDDEPKTAAEITTLQAALKASEDARKASDERLSGLEATERSRRYHDIILGRDDEGVKQAKEASVALHPMVGDLAKKMQIMEALTASKGEDSDEFKAYVAAEREHAAQLHTAGTFAEAGADSHDGGVESSAIKEFEKRVIALTGGENALSHEDAITKVAAEDPRLYDRYDREKTGRKSSYPSS